METKSEAAEWCAATRKKFAEDLWRKLRDLARPYVGSHWSTPDLLDELRESVSASISNALKRIGGWPEENRRLLGLDHGLLVTADLGQIAIELPLGLRLYFEQGESAFIKRFRHNCPRCEFLAHTLGHDLYHCNEKVIARSSDVLSDYAWLLDGSDRSLGLDHPLGFAHRLARDRGLSTLDNDGLGFRFSNDLRRLFSDRPSRAVIACAAAEDGRGEGAVLWSVGLHVSQELIDHGSANISDLGLGDAPHGLSIWEGVYGAGTDGTAKREPRGTFRKLTDQEWDAVRLGHCPWNEAEWFRQKHELDPIEVTS